MSFLMNLNKQQAQAVQTTDQHLRIIAGAGSGKTRVVTTRIAYLIEEKHVLPNKILAITFTNKAAKEMKDRVQQMIGDLSASVRISTIHSFCVRLLREDILSMGYPRNFTILDSDDQKSILKEAYKELKLDVKAYSYGSVLGYISANKTNFVDPMMAKANAGVWEAEKAKADVYAFYERRLQEMYALDFDDLLIFTYRLLQHDEQVRLKWQRRFTYLHVDEFQDVDALQYGIIRLLVSEDSYLCVVGDPDQTIYTWRGAQVDIIMHFDKDFPNCKTVFLNQNYRSTQTILDGANALIANNMNRLEKDLFTESGKGSQIIHYTATADNDEPMWVIMRIKELIQKGVKPSDIAVLYRSNYLSRGLEKILLNAKIPYRIYGGMRFYDRQEIKDSLSYLRLLAPKHEDDDKELYKDLAIHRIINVPKRGIGAKTMQMIELQAQHDETNMYEIIKHYEIGKGKAKANLARFVEVVEKYRGLVDELPLEQLLKGLLEDCGYMDMLREDKEIERLENIKELLSDLVTFEEENPTGTLDDYLQDISLYTDKETNEVHDFIQLMSIHAAKGLEFDYVFVYSLCEGIFPNERSMNEGGRAALEEERRLAYVAFTRAKKQLYLSDSYGYSFVLDKVKKASRFVEELPADCLLEVGAKLHQSQGGRSASEFLSKRRYDEDEHQEDIVQMRYEESAKPSEKPKKNRAIRKGDLVNHKLFGDGVVIRIEDGMATIAFEQSIGIKKILASHPSLSKK